MRVGIITMHKVINCGSALQAYALQKTIERLGCYCELVDYQYPNPYYNRKHRKEWLLSLIRKNWIIWIYRKIRYKPKSNNFMQRNLFQCFWRKNFILTQKFFTKEEIVNSHISYDLRIIGSDQVWNPHTMYGDPVYFFDFSNNGSRIISYGSSFSCNVLPLKYRNKYAQYLLRLSSISVRECSGAKIVKDLIGKDAKIVCDPTMLLDKVDYCFLAEDSTVKIKDDYLFAYVLRYAYNPHPAIDTLIDQISEKYGLKIVYFGDDSSFLGRTGITTLENIGPNEFLYLIKNAKYIVTSSFHGTVFANIFNIDFYSVIPSDDYDSRIFSFLKKIGQEDRIVESKKNWKISDESKVDFYSHQKLYDDFRNNSINYIKSIISS